MYKLIRKNLYTITDETWDNLDCIPVRVYTKENGLKRDWIQTNNKRIKVQYIEKNLWSIKVIMLRR